MVNKFFKKIDKILLSYLGIENELTHPIYVKSISNKIYISNHTSFKRHKIKESWEDFSLKNIEAIESKQLGIAIGKSIAKNLIIKFDSTDFNREL